MFHIILLLGSYDPDTKNILITIKNRILNEFNGINIYPFLLEDIKLFTSYTYFAIAEERESEISIFIYRHDGHPFEEIEVLKPSTNLSEYIKEKIKEVVNEEIREETILNKFETLAWMSKVIIIVRDRERTKGGEIAELAYLMFKGYGEKCILFKRDEIILSSMFMEFLDKFNINIRGYSSQNELVESVIRYLRYRLEEDA